MSNVKEAQYDFDFNYDIKTQGRVSRESLKKNIYSNLMAHGVKSLFSQISLSGVKSFLSKVES